jgi:hypothetical protein
MALKSKNRRQQQNRFNMFEADADMKQLLVKSGDNDRAVALPAQREVAEAVQIPLREGILEGDIVGNLFTPMRFEEGQSVEFPLDFIVPGTEKEYVAYTIPNHGRIPERHVEGDLVVVQTYDVGSSIDWLLKYARQGRWDIVGRGLAVLEATFVRKMNIDAWHTIIAAIVDRNIIVFDAAAPASFFSKRLISLMKSTMVRQGGGNLASANPIELTDVFLSPEGVENMRNWTLEDVDDVTRRQIFQGSGWGGLSGIYGVDFNELTELGAGQPFQQYFTSLGGTLATADTELVLGLDLSDPSVFVMPVRQEIEIFEDETLHRQRRQGYYGWAEHGFAILDNRRVIGGSF